jgi:iron(III) transport system permease protein
LLVFSAAIALVLAAPMLFILYQGLSSDPEIWRRLWRLGWLRKLFWNTFFLAAATTLGALVLGVALAWLTERMEIRGRRWWSSLLAAPLVIPSYLSAIAYESLMGPWGLIADWLRALRATCFIAVVPEVEGFGGAALVLTLGTYPYVYLLVRAALRELNPSFEDAARISGKKPWTIFWTTTLPLIAPALSASTLLVAVTVIADFGVVERMKFATFTTAVYDQLISRFDRATASALSAALIAATLVLLWAQLKAWGRGKYYYRTERRPQARRPLPSRRWAVYFLLAFVPALALFVPVAVFGYWWVEGWLKPSDAQALWGTGWIDLLRYAAHGFVAAGLAATMALGCAMPLAYLAVRHREQRWGGALSWISQVGFALPGVLVALGLAFALHRYAPDLYSHFGILVIAYVILFFPLGFQALESGLSQIPQQLEESARLLGKKIMRIWWQVTLPLLLPAAAAGWILVFTNAMRELPATLLLRPAGFDTLPVRIWVATGEGFLTQAAPAALLLIVLSLPLLFLLSHERQRKIEVRD